MQKQSEFIFFSHKPKCRVFVSSSELGEVLIFNSQCNIWWTVALLEPAKAGMLEKKCVDRSISSTPTLPGQSAMNLEDYLGGGFKHVLFSSLPREMIQFD